ncbi:MAG: hypothetical protein LBB48_04195 [Treponema sp.]|jgi:hypothetical protein|nr:hypothetical protein [Treponema sp.]
MKKNRFIVLGVLAMAPAFGLILAGSEDGGDTGGGLPEAFTGEAITRPLATIIVSGKASSTMFMKSKHLPE